MDNTSLAPRTTHGGRPDKPTEASTPGGLLASFDELLTARTAIVLRADTEAPLGSRNLLLGALVCCLLYGAMAGAFEGGGQILLAALKAPLIVAFSLLLCLPSLYVFGATSGVRWSPRRLLAAVSGFAGTLGLLLLALVPVAWLFSVSSRHLTAVVWLHVLLWALALGFGWRFLGSTLRELGSRGGMILWLLLFSVVSFQVVTFVRPVLYREPGAPAFGGGKLFFLEHLGEVGRLDDKLNPPQEDKAEPQGQR